ncbi:MAG: bifunctional diguanylate cyclase/phosphodiesterase, partial [Sulfurimonadaceae bacterium]|nr:bifunctional diguanylate cyclase/phosphodiesterase [Sulfurimonadaceae bacterium]
MTFSNPLFTRLLLPAIAIIIVATLVSYFLLNAHMTALLESMQGAGLNKEELTASASTHSLIIIASAYGVLIILALLALDWYRRNVHLPIKTLGTMVAHFKVGQKVKLDAPTSQLHDLHQIHDSLLDLSNRYERQNIRQRILKQSIDNHAMYDQLTSLPNRTKLNEMLEHLIEQSRYTHDGFALLALDLDNFKLINDTIGHEIGDELLKECAKRIYASLKDDDILARIGGDEFVIVVNDKRRDQDYHQIAKNVISMLHEKFVVHGHEFVISASVGISVYPQNGKDGGTLLKHADIAMYEAKEEGRNGYCFFHNDMVERIHNQLYLEQEMREALEKGQFTLFYQPQVDTLTAEVIGAEALIRWIHPEQGIISPVRFIELAEKTGFIHELGEWILEESCRMLSRHEELLSGLKLSVNISAMQFQQPDFVANVQKTLAAYNTPAERLVFEITETLLMADKESSLQTLHTLKALGISIAMDDFGTGYSSLAYLKEFPVDIIKIDKSFIQGAFDNAEDYNIIRAIIGLGNELGLKVVAEGVEQLHQYEFLRTSHCSAIQGYLFSKPLPESEYVDYLLEYNQF